MAEQKRDSGQSATVHIDLGLGNVFKGIGSLMDLVAELSETGETVTNRTGEIKFGEGNDLRGVYGFTVRTDIGGVPHVESFGNIRETDDGPIVDEAREPLVDIFDEAEGSVLVVIELPGVSEGEISLAVQDDVLALTTTGKRKYAKEILLPVPVLQEGMTTNYNNGVLEVHLRQQ